MIFRLARAAQQLQLEEILNDFVKLWSMLQAQNFKFGGDAG